VPELTVVLLGRSTAVSASRGGATRRSGRDCDEP
jgi:hypothetical protein